MLWSIEYDFLYLSAKKKRHVLKANKTLTILKKIFFFFEFEFEFEFEFKFEFIIIILFKSWYLDIII